MSTITENDLKELKDLINHRFNALEKGQTEIKEQVSGLDKRLAVIEARMEEWRPSLQKIPDLAEKVGELKNWRQIVIILLTSSVGGAIGWLLHGGNLKP